MEIEITLPQLSGKGHHAHGAQRRDGQRQPGNGRGAALGRDSVARSGMACGQAGALLQLTLFLIVGCSEQREGVSEREPPVPAPARPAIDLTPALDALPLHHGDAVRAFYATRDYKPAWLGPDCEKRLAALRGAVAAAATHGLTPAHYHADSLSSVACDVNGEVLASDTWMALASDLTRGRVDRVTVEPHWNLPRRAFNGPAALEAALQTSDAVAILPQLAPRDAYYAALQEMLALHRQIAARGGWPSVSPGRKLERGDKGERVDELRRGRGGIRRGDGLVIRGGRSRICRNRLRRHCGVQALVGQI